MGLVPSLYDCDSILSVDYTVDDGKGGKIHVNGNLYVKPFPRQFGN